MSFVTVQFSIALEKNENRLLNLSTITCAVFVLVATQAVQASETDPPTYQLAPELAVEGQVQGAVGPRYCLGVSMQNVLCWIRAYGWVPGVQITAVVPGSAAANSGLEVGDVIIWANNQHVQTWDQLKDAITRSTGFPPRAWSRGGPRTTRRGADCPGPARPSSATACSSSAVSTATLPAATSAATSPAAVRSSERDSSAAASAATGTAAGAASPEACS